LVENFEEELDHKNEMRVHNRGEEGAWSCFRGTTHFLT